MKDTLRAYESIFGLLPDVDNPTPLVRLNTCPALTTRKCSPSSSGTTRSAR